MDRKFIKPWVDGVAAYVPGKTIEGCVKLASNENNYGPSPKVKEALGKAASYVGMYPYKDMLVREALGRYCGVGAENIILGNGSDELIDLILKTFKGPVFTFSPTFASYVIYSKVLNEAYSDVCLREDFAFPMEEFLAGAKNAGIIFLCSPNNPTGTVLSESEIKEVLDLGKPTVVDEAYFEFCGKTTVPLLKDYGNLIVTRTLAKAFALAGLRVGYAAASSDIISTMLKVKPPFNVSLLAQEAALAALGDVAYMKSNVKKILADRDLLYKKLEERFKPVKPYGNFIFTETTPYSSTEFYDRLLKAGFITRPFGKPKGFSAEYCRITVGTTPENKKLMTALDAL